MELLNDLLDGEKHIRDLVYLPTEELVDNRQQRRITFLPLVPAAVIAS